MLDIFRQCNKVTIVIIISNIISKNIFSMCSKPWANPDLLLSNSFLSSVSSFIYILLKEICICMFSLYMTGLKNYCSYLSHTKSFFYKKPCSRPDAKSFLIFGHTLVLKVSLKFLKLTKKDCIENDIKHVDIPNY